MKKKKYTKFYISLLLLGLSLIALFGYSTARGAFANQKQPTYTPLPVNGSTMLDQEIQLYRNELMGDLPDNARKLIQEKLTILYNEATMQARERQRATEIYLTGTVTPGPTYVFHELRITGIIQYPSVPYSSMVFISTNGWQEKIGEHYVSVIAGAFRNTPEQGVVEVELDWLHQVMDFNTPDKSGAVKITDFKGYRLVLTTLDGSQTYYFDVPAMQFVNSLDEVVPTITPAPTLTERPLRPLVTRTPINPNPYPNP